VEKCIRLYATTCYTVLLGYLLISQLQYLK